MRARSLLAVVAVLGCAAGVKVARAQPIAAIAFAPDPAASILIGPSGQLWMPDGPLGWQRTTGGGTAADVHGAVLAADEPVVVGKAAPAYRHRGGQWFSVQLGERGKTLVGSGPRPTLVVGRQVFVWDRTRWQRVGVAPGPITAVWAASDKLVYVAGADTVWRLVRKRFVVHAPIAVRGFAVGRSAHAWAVTEDGRLYDATAKATIAVALGGAPVRVAMVASGPRDAAWIVGTRDTTRVFARQRGDAWEELALPTIAVDDEVLGFAIDAGEAALLVTRGGAVWRRGGDGAWQAATRTEVEPAPHPGPGPARMP